MAAEDRALGIPCNERGIKSAATWFVHENDRATEARFGILVANLVADIDPKIRQ